MLKMVQFYAIPFSKVVQLKTEKRSVFIGPCITVRQSQGQGKHKMTIHPTQVKSSLTFFELDIVQWTKILYFI